MRFARFIALFAASGLCPQAFADEGPDAFDQIAIACEFPTIPTVIMSYARPFNDLSGVMTVGGRGPVTMTLGSGTMRFEGATIDGYSFRWSPANQVMDVDDANDTVLSESGKCHDVPFGAETPLRLQRP